MAGGLFNVPLKCSGPCTVVSLHTYFFIPCSGFTQGPAVSLQPPDAAIAISRCKRSASAAACRQADFHSGDIQITGLSTNSGAPISPSNICIPPMPTRCIHSRSAVMPGSVTLPLIQCHQTRGLALSGGCLNACSRLFAAAAPPAVEVASTVVFAASFPLATAAACPASIIGIPATKIIPRIPPRIALSVLIAALHQP